VAAHGELIYPARLPGFVALEDGAIVGSASPRSGPAQSTHRGHS
jgi:hypothetical protein